MNSDTDNNDDEVKGPRSPYDTDPTPEEDLWFIQPPFEDALPSDMPWPVATREQEGDAAVWRAGEAAQYRELVGAAQTLARFGERLKRFPHDVYERFALSSVSAVLRSEGVWLGPDQIALFRMLRIGADDAARDLARASWAMRRLMGNIQTGGPLDGLHAFLGRSVVRTSQPVPGDDRPLGIELEALGGHWVAAIEGMKDSHPLTQAAFAFAEWRGQGITPFEEMLEPCVAVMQIGAASLAPFLPLAEGQRTGRLRLGGGIEPRLAAFYGAVEAGALKALMELDRLADWQIRAEQKTVEFSGRTPPRLIELLLRLPVVSAELVAETLPCSRPAARRNLTLFAERGLVREVTGQNRYRFWTVQLTG
jgi:HTH DNA binding domain